MRGAVAVLVDVTPLRRLETVRRDFVANASHELKTPLTSIRGYAETLLSDAALPDDLRHRFLTTIHDNAARLHRIVEDLLDLSRLESGGWRPVPRPVDIAGVAADVWEGLHHIAERKAIGFAIDAASQPTALGDPVGVRQILANLLDNAIRYTPDGGRVTVRVARSNRPGRRAGAGPFALGLPHPRQIPGTGSSSRSSTPASGSRATRSLASSSASTASIRPGPAKRAAPVSASRSSNTSSAAWAATSSPRASSARGARSVSGSPPRRHPPSRESVAGP